MLDLTTNVSSLIAQNSLNNTSNELQTSLQRLSTGLKINTGADGPAALVISQEQQAQITGLQQAITNTSEATSMVQTTEGALSTVNDLLDQIRALALDSANSGVNDPTTQAANQAEVTNALQTIDRIAANTQFGTRRVLDGSAGLSGISNNNSVTFINAQANLSKAGSYAINITRSAQAGSVLASAPTTGNLATNETLTINGVNVGLTAGQNQTQVINTINSFTGQTGVTASDFKTSVSQTSAYLDTSNGNADATGATTLANIQGSQAVFAASNLTISGTDGDGTAVTGTFAITSATTLQDILDKINGTNTGGNNAALTKIYNHATASIVNGQIVLTSDSATGDPLATNQNFSLNFAESANPENVPWQNLTTYGGDSTRLQTQQFGSLSSFTVTSNVAASGTSSGFGTAVQTGTGVDVAGTIGGFAATGNGDVLTGNTGDGAQGISISTGPNAGDTVTGVSGSVGSVVVTDNSLIFQIGANANQTVKVGVDSVATDALGLNVPGNQFANLGQINIQTESGAQNAIGVIDAAISQVSTLRGTLGAVQAQTLSENGNNLETTLENTTAAEGVIRDTDFAAETANYSQYQVLMQVGTAVLANSNQIGQLVTHLFQ